MDEATAMQNDLTWDDVFAVCKLMQIEFDFYEDMMDVRRPGSAHGTVFTDPAAALEFISAEEHPLETKYASILRTKP